MVRREFLGVFFLFYGKIKKREINKSILYLFVCTRTTYGGSDAAFVKRKNKFFLSLHLHP